MFARTQYVMMLDIDFYPCTNFRNVLKTPYNVKASVNHTILDRLKNGRAALVVPAFEYVDFEEGTK